MIRVYRIARTKFVDDLSGIGARIYGGRWNHKGTSIVYTSENRALATIEFLVHVPEAAVPDDIKIATLKIDARDALQEISMNDLPDNWRAYPAHLKLADIGTSWASEKASLLLRVPSAVVEDEFNILINPLHPDIKFVSIESIKELRLDPRLKE